MIASKMINSSVKILTDLADIKTPLGVKKIISIWPDLSCETKLAFLSYLSDIKISVPLELLLLIAESDNPFLINTALKNIYLDGKDKKQAKVIQMIESHPSSVVNCSFSEKEFAYGLAPSPEIFLDMDQNHRIAFFSVCKCVGCFSGALELLHKKIPNYELKEIITQFAHNKALKTYWDGDLPYDGSVWYIYNNEFKNIWKIVSKIDIDISMPLMETLPAETINYRSIPDETFDQLSEDHLEVLLWRNDVHLQEKRHTIFFENSYPKHIRDAASNNLELSDNDILKLYKSKDIQRIMSILDRANLTLVQRLGALNLISQLDKEAYDYESFQPAMEHQLKEFREKLSTIKEKETTDYLLRPLKILTAAESILPWGEDSYVIPKWTEWGKDDAETMTIEISQRVEVSNTWELYIKLKKEEKFISRILDERHISELGGDWYFDLEAKEQKEKRVATEDNLIELKEFLENNLAKLHAQANCIEGRTKYILLIVMGVVIGYLARDFI